MPDAPWVVDYDRYFNLYYQCEPVEEFETETEEETEDE